MKLAIPQPHFLRQLQLVEHAVNDRTTLPILSNVLLQTQEQELILTATDLDVGIQCRFPLTSPAEPGAVALPARRLTTIVRELPDEPIVLEAKKNAAATLMCGRSSFRVPGLPAEDFPALPAAGTTSGVRLPQGTLKALIQQTAYAMSMEESRFILNGALLSAQRKHLALVATDGRRLAAATAALVEPARVGLDVVLPAKTVRELARLLQPEEPDEVVLSTLQDNQLSLTFGGIAVITRLIDGQFPPYEKVIPPASKHQARCPREGLINALRRAGLMTTASSQAVVLEFGAQRLVVSKESADVGSAREELEIAYAGEPMTVAFNPEFWLDVLKVIDGEEVAIELGGPERPAVIRQPGFTYVVLPMKVS
jgi:DNA polymerase-3 subunit beta